MTNKEKKTEKKEEVVVETGKCNDKQCPEHRTLATRGRIFEGTVVKKHHRRIAIEFDRTVYMKKYERYMKNKTKLHARLPSCKEASVHVGDFVQIQECRPLSKIIHFAYIKKLRGISK
ncbi:MAG: 30S ribosomal protein S17 [Nanoarchaeota archaeon]